MRGRPTGQVTMLSLQTPEQRVPKGHALRRVKVLADQALAAMSSYPSDEPRASAAALAEGRRAHGAPRSVGAAFSLLRHHQR